MHHQPRHAMIEHDLAFSSVASLRVLLVPVQPIKRDVYAKHCALIRKFTRIALRDVPVDPRGPSVAQLSAQPFSRGCVLFDYLDSYSKAQGYLEELQLSRRVVGVIGIVQSDEWQDGSGSGCLDEARSEFERLLGQHPQCLASRCYAFDPPEGMPDNVEGMVMVPSVGDLNFYISTLLADFAASILHELSNLASYLDTRTYVSTPRDPNASRPTNYRRSTLPELPGKLDRSVNIERTASATPPQKTRTASRLSSIGSGVVGSTTSDTNTAAAADKSTKRKMQARLLKLKADLRALAGRWEEASHMYDEAIQTFKIMSDDVWHASALENATMLAVIQLLHNSTVEVCWSPNVKMTGKADETFTAHHFR